MATNRHSKACRCRSCQSLRNLRRMAAVADSLEEKAVRTRLSNNVDLLDKKIDRLTRLVTTFNNSIEKVEKDTTRSLDRIQLQKRAQVKRITEKYERLESELVYSGDALIDEMSSFIENTIKDLRGRIIMAKDCLVQSLHGEKSLIGEADSIEHSLQRILKTSVPDLQLSPMLELRCPGVEYRDIELSLVESNKSPVPSTRNEEMPESITTYKPSPVTSKSSSTTINKPSNSNPGTSRSQPSTPRPERSANKKLDCRGDFDKPEIAERLNESESEAEAVETEAVEAEAAETEALEDKSDSQYESILSQKSQSHCSIESPRCQLVSFSTSICQAQIPGFSSHIAHAGTNAFIVDSFAPSIYKINEYYEVQRLLCVDRSRAVVGLAASVDYLYVQYMDVTEYRRTIFVYTTENGRFIKKWKSPNLLGSSIALVQGHLVISSRDKVMVCTPTGKHIKDIALSPSCVKTLCTLPPNCVVLCSTYDNLLMKLNIETEEVCWKSYHIESPVCATADSSGRVYVLVQPSVICVLDAASGELLMQSTLSCPGGVMEGLCVTEQGLLLSAISYRGNKDNNPGCYSVLNAFRIDAVC